MAGQASEKRMRPVWKCSRCSAAFELDSENAAIRGYVHSTFRSCRETAPSFDGIEPTEIHGILAELPGERAAPSHWRDAAMIERCEWALRETAGNTAAASKLLNISRYTLYRWLRRRAEPGYGRGKRMLRDRRRFAG